MAQSASAAQQGLRGADIGDDQTVQLRPVQRAGASEGEAPLAAPQGDLVAQGRWQQGGVWIQQQRAQVERAAGDIGGGIAKRRFGKGIDAEDLQQLSGPVGVRQSAGHHRSRLAEAAFQPQLGIDGFGNALWPAHQAMGGMAGQAIHGQIETSPGAGVGQIHRQHHRDAERDAENRQPQLPGMAHRMAQQRLPEQRRHRVNSRICPAFSTRMRSARAATSWLWVTMTMVVSA